jgi:hypothetical protein
VIDDPGGDDLFYDYQPQPQMTLADHSPLRYEASAVDEEEETELVLQEQLDSQPTSPTAKNATVDWKKFKPITHEEFQRRKRATKPGWLTMVQILLGGAAAIPVSLLIIWHVLGKDIGGAGPMVGQYLPWVVPSKFRPAKEVPEAFWDRPKQVPQFDRPSTLPRLGEPSENKNQRPEVAKVGQEKADEATDKTIDKTIDKESTSPSNAEQLDREQDSSLEQTPVQDSNNQVASALQELTTKQIAWQSYSGEDRTEKRNLAQQFFKAICQVSSSLMDADDASPATRIWFDKAESICREVIKDSSLVSLIDQGANATLKMPLSSIDGLALIAEIKDVSQEEGNRQVEFVRGLSSEGKPIRCLARSSTHRDLVTGGRYLLLGRMTQAKSGSDDSSPERSLEAIYEIGLAVRLP